MCKLYVNGNVNVNVNVKVNVNVTGNVNSVREFREDIDINIYRNIYIESGVYGVAGSVNVTCIFC